MNTTTTVKSDDGGRKVAQPYTVADLELGQKLVRQLHGINGGFEDWSEHLAKAIAAERTAASERIRVLEEALKPFTTVPPGGNGANERLLIISTKGGAYHILESDLIRAHATGTTP